MSAALYSLGRWAFRARRLVLLLWVAVLLLLFAAAGLLGVGTDNTYRIPGTESQEALDGLARTFPEVSGASAQLIAVAPPDGSVADDVFESAVDEAVTAIADIPQVTSAPSPYGGSGANISEDESAVLVPIQLSVGTTAVLPSTSAALQDAGVDLQRALPAASVVAVGGQLFGQDPAGISITELLGIAVAFVVLLLTFGSLIAAGLPLVTALLGVGASLSLVLAATAFTTVTSTTPLLALMLGLAVGIDYALFILARHQDHLKEGLEPEEAAARSIATSGSAVVFAAMTVIIALVGLTVAGIPFLTTMGLAAALAVAIAVAVSLTLMPALLGFAGWRVVSRRWRPGTASGGDAVPDEHGARDEEESLRPLEDATFGEAGDEEDAGPPATAEPPATPDRRGGFFGGWVAAATRWPLVTVVLVTGLLAAAALPALHLRLALPDAGALAPDSPGRETYDLISEHFGPGYNGPLLVTGSVIQSSDPVGVMDSIGAEIAAVDGVAMVPVSTPNQAGDTGIVQVIPVGAPVAPSTGELVAELRGMHAHFESAYGVDLAVTGYTAAGIDISARLAGALLPFGLLVVGLSLVLLAMVFRSLVVPITAALGYVLSIGAALGLTALVFVDGLFAGPLNVAAVGYVISFMPIILMGVLFGLAMDYEVFLVSRMREDYAHGGDARGAVVRGFRASARVVTAAATIMFAVFAAFVPEGDASIQPIAFGLAVGVVIDAFLVRMTLIPAILVMFGERAWWMPAALERMLPHFDVEGAGLATELALEGWPDAGTDAAIATDAARAKAGDSVSPPLTLIVAGGEAAVIHGGSSSDRTALLLALGGRAPIVDGRARVAGFALPPRGSSVRAHSSYLRLAASTDPSAALADALETAPAILLIDGVDDVPDSGVRAELAAQLTSAISRDPVMGIVASGRSADAGVGVIPTGVALSAIPLESAVVGERV